MSGPAGEVRVFADYAADVREEADVVVVGSGPIGCLHVRLARARGAARVFLVDLNAERLAMMKPGAWLLNFGRGHVVRDDDLVAAVKAKKIAGAMLDVFRQEPLPAEHPFWTTEGIIVLPHIGGPHPQRDRFVARLFVENLGRFLDGKPLKEVVDRKAGY